MLGEGADGGRKAARAGVSVPKLVGGAETHVYRQSEPCEDLGGAVQRVGRHGYEGDPIHGNTVPAVGGHEGVERETEGQEVQSGGECGLWKCQWCGCGSADDTAGCAEDKIDVGKRGMC